MASSTSTAATAATAVTETKLWKRSPKNIVCLGDALREFYCFEKPEVLRPYLLLEDEKHEYTESQGKLMNDIVELFGAKPEPGGSVPRSAWVARWINSDPHSSVSFVGAVGDDVDTKESKTLVLNHYDKQEGQPSGTVAVIATSPLNRTTCTHLAAEKAFRKEFLEEEVVATCVKQAHLIYTDGIFLSHSSDLLYNLTDFIYLNYLTMPFALNLSAQYIVQKEFKGIIDILPKVDILFGGKKEIQELYTKIRKVYSDITVAVQTLANHEQQEDKEVRLVVCTDGANPVLYCQTDGNVEQFKVPAMENIHDTVGARDAFIGAFLAIWLQTEDITTAISAGVETAQLVLQKPQFQLPEKVPEALNFFSDL